jgi:hypothetical protein
LGILFLALAFLFLGVLLLVPGVLFLDPRSVPGVRVPGVGAPGIGAPGVPGSWRCWLLGNAGSWALVAPRHCWLLDVTGPGSLGSPRQSRQSLAATRPPTASPYLLVIEVMGCGLRVF